MNRNFTRLVCAGIASFCMMSAMGQEKATTVRITDRAFLESRAELRADKAEWWPDSVITYDYLGEPTNKEYYDKENRTVTYVRLENGSWVQNGPHSSDGYYFWDATASFHEHEEYVTVQIVHIFTVGVGSHEKERYSYNTAYDDRENLISVEFTPKGLPDGDVAHTYRMKYNSDNKLLSYEYYWYDLLLSRNLYEYNENGDLTYCKTYSYDEESDSMKPNILQQVKYDNDGRPVEGYDLWLNFGENSSHYVFYYPDATTTPGTEVENNTPVGDANEGGFDLNVNIPTDSIASGSVTVTLPEGLTLDETNTTLAVDVAGLFDLTITKQENNSWLIGIKLKPSSKSGALRADEALGAMLHVAYKVKDTLPRGTYNISVNSILFETPFGNMIPEPAIIVPANINRWAVANEQIESPQTEVYITGNTLYINTPLPDVLSIYTAAGVKVYESPVPAGASTISAAALPQGMLILKGKSGWVKKVVK